MLSRKANEPARPDLDTIRAGIADLKTERERTADMAPARVDMVTWLDATIDHYAGAHQTAFGSTGDEKDFQYLLASMFIPRNDDVGAAVIGAACLFTPAAVREYFLGAIEENLRHHPPGLPTDERRAALKTLDAKMLDGEISEELAIIALEDAGQTIDRRADLDPRAFFKAYKTPKEGYAGMLKLKDQAEEFNAGVRLVSKRLNEARVEKGRAAARIKGPNVMRRTSQPGAAVREYENVTQIEKEAVDRKHDPVIACLMTALKKAEERWRPLAALCVKLVEHAKETGIAPAEKGVTDKMQMFEADATTPGSDDTGDVADVATGSDRAGDVATLAAHVKHASPGHTPGDPAYGPGGADAGIFMGED